MEYDKIIRAQEEVNMQEVQETKINQEIELTDEYREQINAIHDYEMCIRDSAQWGQSTKLLHHPGK